MREREAAHAGKQADKKEAADRMYEKVKAEMEEAMRRCVCVCVCRGVGGGGSVNTPQPGSVIIQEAVEAIRTAWAPMLVWSNF